MAVPLYDMLTALLVPLSGTVLGSAFVLLIKGEIPVLVEKALLGFASGVMVAASVWSLLLPGMAMSAPLGKAAVVPAAAGVLLGMGFLLFIDRMTPHLHLGAAKPEGPRSHLSRSAMIALAVTIHNVPEGMAVGVVVAAVIQGGTAFPAAAIIATAVGIAVQNIPEGAIVSMPLRAAGNSRRRSFLIGSLSGLVEPLSALLIILLSELLTPALPCLLAFAAGAMLYVVIEELIPEASAGEHSNIGTMGFAVGFVIMMTLDCVMG